MAIDDSLGTGTNAPEPPTDGEATAVEQSHISLTKFEQTAVGGTLDLKHSLAAIVLDRLTALRWSADELAERVGTTGKFIVQIALGDRNCDFDIAGKILHALGVRARLVVVP